MVDSTEPLISNPNDVGEEVTLRHDPIDPQSILIDRHGWEWLNAVMLAWGAELCAVLGLVLARSGPIHGSL